MYLLKSVCFRLLPYLPPLLDACVLSPVAAHRCESVCVCLGRSEKLQYRKLLFCRQMREVCVYVCASQAKAHTALAEGKPKHF